MVWGRDSYCSNPCDQCNIGIDWATFEGHLIEMWRAALGHFLEKWCIWDTQSKLRFVLTIATILALSFLHPWPSFWHKRYHCLHSDDITMLYKLTVNHVIKIKILMIKNILIVKMLINVTSPLTDYKLDHPIFTSKNVNILVCLRDWDNWTVVLLHCLLCFDTVGWAAGGHPPADATATHCFLLQ